MGGLSGRPHNSAVPRRELRTLPTEAIATCDVHDRNIARNAGSPQQVITRAWHLVAVFLVFALAGVGCSDQGGSQSGSGASRANGSASSDGVPLVREAEQGNVRLKVEVTPPEPRLSDLVTMDIHISAASGYELRAPEFGKAVGDFRVRDFFEVPVRATDGVERHFRYVLEPDFAGRNLIRSVAIEFVDRRDASKPDPESELIETEPLELEITSDLGDAVPDLAQLEANHEPESLPWSASTWTWVIASGVLLCSAAAWYFVRKRRVAPTHHVERRSPEEIAHEELAALLAANLIELGEFKEFYLRLTAIVRRYIEETTGIRAYEQTTEEFLREMRAREVFSAVRSQQLSEFLQAADMVKYAGGEPSTEQIDEAVQRAREFISPSAVDAVHSSEPTDDRTSFVEAR